VTLAKKKNITKIIIKYIFTFAISMLLTITVLSRQYIFDQIVVYRFSPSPEVASLIKQAGVNDYGNFLFLASKPIIESTQDFNGDCARTENISSILGCYNNGKIYIYNVNDPQLNGVKEVTAVHEVLHAAYVRLGFFEKEKINKLLDTEYKKLESQKELVDRMAFYEKIEPGQRYNELHSVIGTEIAEISPELEEYYSRYFNDRQKVVTLNKNYLNVFKKYDDRRLELEVQLGSLNSDIASRKSKYEEDVLAINSDITRFNEKANSDGFMTMLQFNSERNLLSGRIDSLEVTRTGITRDIELYNSLYSEYDSNISQLKKLYNSIDSTLAPAPSI